MARWRPGLSGAGCAPSIALNATAAPRCRGAAEVVLKKSGRRVGGLGVDALAERYGVELRVRRLRLVQVGRQEAHDLVLAEFLSPGDQRSIAAHS
jgi:hypothetical protein